MALPERMNASILFWSRLMKDRRCRYCQQVFQPDLYHPQQQVCSQPACQSQRRSDYHRQKIASDPVYQQVCLESPRKWREANPGYWRKYRQDHPEQVERNRRKQRLRDEKRRLVNLANNILLKSPRPLAYKPGHAVGVFQVARADSGTSEWSCRIPF